jgi:hypothetical protein
MKTPDKNTLCFFALLKAGLWEQGVRLSEYEGVDLAAVFRLGSEQSVVGLVTAGLELVQDVSIPRKDRLPFMQRVLVLEDRNSRMNAYIGDLLGRLRVEGIRPLLVKGQGIAQCYSRPQWRASGDIDLLLQDDGQYGHAKALLLPKATRIQQEYSSYKHAGMQVDGWEVELHGSLRSRLSSRIDNYIDSVQKDTFEKNHVRILKIGDSQVEVPSPDNDVVFVFTHILHHFYIEGIGLRQICDWCRLMWTFRDTLDVPLLQKRLEAMGLMSEWKAFAAYAVEWLGMPVEAMPLYSASKYWKRKAAYINGFVMKVGNFGHKRMAERGKKKRSYYIGKMCSLFSKAADYARHSVIFPLDSPRFFCHLLSDGIRATKRGE